MDERMVTKLRVKEANVRTYRDHESGIHLVKNQVYHERTKHTDVWLYFVWEVISKKKVPSEKFKHCLRILQVMKSKFKLRWRIVR